MDACLSADYFEFLENYDFFEYAEEMLKQGQILEKDFPEYWTSVGKIIYTKHLVKICKDPYQLKSWQFVQDFNKLLDVFGEICLLGLFNYQLKMLSFENQSYLLGFPVHIHLPTREQVDTALESLYKIGIKEYCKEAKKRVENYFGENRIKLGREFKILNLENVHGDNIYTFVPFDIIEFYADDGVYYFTRPEFDFLLTKKKNPYTNLDLSVVVLVQIESRLKLASHFSLPNSQPLSYMLKNLTSLTSANPESSSDKQKIIPICPPPPQQVQPSTRITNLDQLLDLVFRHQVYHHHHGDEEDSLNVDDIDDQEDYNDEEENDYEE